MDDDAPSIAAQMQSYPSERVYGHHSHFHNCRRINLILGTNICPVFFGLLPREGYLCVQKS